MRRSGAASRCARRVRLPLRGQHRLARLRCRQAPCFPFNCARRSGAREHQNACECRRRRAQRQGGGPRALAGAHRGRLFGPDARSVRSDCSAIASCNASAVSGSLPLYPEVRDTSPARGSTAPRAVHAVLSYAPRSVLAPALRRAQLNGKQEADARPACAVPATVRRPRNALSRTRPCRPRCHCPTASGGKAAAWQAASPDTGRRKGRAPRSPNARSAGDGLRAHVSRVRTGLVRSAMHRLPAGRLRAARLPLPPSSTRFAPCCPR
ncbi:hypothetical protein BLA24064_05392 [Burkholderia latens]|uniref:Uncharacterized protein n=1 Tax=Burkholderia latens TaxID=488446 RepID=A0A6P2Q084_9BURK|nr:hypothetical protein BLA24064_05392 [Burkholderia latens]